MAIQDLKVSMAYSGRDIASLSDRPNQDGMSASALKARFDQLNKEVIPNYNDLIDLLDVYIQTNDSDIVALENGIEALGISLNALGLSVQDVLDAYNSGLLSGVYIGDTEPTDERIMVWIDPYSETIAIDEANRVAQENVRQANETIRISSENTRISNENTRISNENTRISQESSRVSAESTRVSQENSRNVFVAYNGSTAYVVGNKVSYNGSSYVCILNSTGNLPTNATYWLLIASKGDNTTASAVTNTPSGNISATDVQGAINELDTEKAPTSHTHDDRYYTETEVDTALANKADKLFATNLVTNGDFSNGTTGWTGIDAVVNGIAEKTATAQYQPISFSLLNPTSYRNHKLYLSALFKADASSTQLLISDAITLTGVVHSGNNQFEQKSVIHTVGATSSNVYCRVQENRASGWTKMYVDNVICLDLTAIFGAGKEPTKGQMDWLLAQKFTNSWFDGTSELTSITDLLTLVNTKANTTQEAWITPTLLNEWTAHLGNTPQYMKDQFGFIHINGSVTRSSGTFPSVLFTLPTGYRPTKNIYVPSISGDQLSEIRVLTDGTVTIQIGVNVWVSVTIPPFN